MPNPDSSRESVGEPARTNEDAWYFQHACQKAGTYNRWLHDLLDPHVGQRVLDAGCGVGNVTRLFLDRELVIGVEINEEFCAHMRETLKAHPNFRLVAADLLGPEIMTLRSERLDTVVLVNVLEHLEDDLLAIQRFGELLVPGGRLAVFVPAHPWLYSDDDRAVGHFRRYTRRGLRSLFQQAGYTIEQCRWVNLAGVPCWLLNKLLRRRITGEQCSAFDHLVPVVAALERLVRPPVGLSLLIVGRRPAAPEAGVEAGQ